MGASLIECRCVPSWESPPPEITLRQYLHSGTIRSFAHDDSGEKSSRLINNVPPGGYDNKGREKSWVVVVKPIKHVGNYDKGF
jgi:hypothetical protein